MKEYQVKDFLLCKIGLRPKQPFWTIQKQSSLKATICKKAVLKILRNLPGKCSLQSYKIGIYVRFVKPRNKWTYFQYKHTIQLVMLKHVYLKFFFLFSSTMLIKDFIYFARRVSRLGLVLSMRLDGRSDIQSAKFAWSVCIQSLNPHLPPLSRRIIKVLKQTYTHSPSSTKVDGWLFRAAISY